MDERSKKINICSKCKRPVDMSKLKDKRTMDEFLRTGLCVHCQIAHYSSIGEDIDEPMTD